MWKYAVGALIVFVAIGILLGLVNPFTSREFRTFQQIRVGMTKDEVEALLGQGAITDPSHVPTMVVAANPGDGRDSLARAKRAGIAHPSVRDFPTRLKPVVEGDNIYRWDFSGGKYILIAFTNGKVVEKDYWEPSL